MTDPHPESIDCLIIGCGPVGALAGNLLGQRGIRTLIVERESSVYHLPRAAHFDDEVMRIFQSVGLHDRFEGTVIPFSGMDLVDAKGRTLFSMDATLGVTSHGHAQAHLFYQPELERTLRRGLERFPCVEFRPNTEVVSLDPSAAGVRVGLRGLDSGRDGVVEAKYVLGCDGARSATRKALSAEMEDLGLHQPWLVIDVLLRRPLDLPTRAIQVCNPRRPATLIPFPAPRRRWEFMLMPGDDPDSIQRPERIRELLRPWADPADYEIERAAVYTFHALVARPWRKGRILLLGDAAHQTPPFLGQGMCAGVRDAFNLCWKLEQVLHHGADDALLDSYERERRPHVVRVIDLAVRMGRVIQSSNRFVGYIRNLGFRASRYFGGSKRMPDSISAIPLGSAVDDSSAVNRAPRSLPFPQPRVRTNDGRTLLLDDALGTGFSLLLLGRDLAGALAPDLVSACADAGLRILRVGADIEDMEGGIGRWCEARGVDAVLLRPDRVPYGAYATAADGGAALMAAVREILRTCLRPEASPAGSLDAPLGSARP